MKKIYKIPLLLSLKMRGLIIDTETTGLSHNYNQVLTVGMMHLEINIKKIKFFETDHIKIKHKEYNLNKIAMQINKIDLEEHHKTALETKDACKKINNFIIKNELQEIPLIGHNIGFDLRFLKELYRQNNEEFLFNPEIIDTRDIWNNLKFKGKIPCTLKGSLKTLANHFNVDYSQAHDAINDCKITASVLQKMLYLYN